MNFRGYKCLYKVNEEARLVFDLTTRYDEKERDLQTKKESLVSNDRRDSHASLLIGLRRIGLR